nr:MAG TPA: hypothetical protein [Caudoviricetes sp.]
MLCFFISQRCGDFFMNRRYVLALSQEDSCTFAT